MGEKIMFNNEEDTKVTVEFEDENEQYLAVPPASV